MIEYSSINKLNLKRWGTVRAVKGWGASAHKQLALFETLADGALQRPFFVNSSKATVAYTGYVVQVLTGGKVE